MIEGLYYFIDSTAKLRRRNLIAFSKRTHLAKWVKTGYHFAMEEQILVVPTPLFHSVGYFQGFCADVKPYQEVLLDEKNVQFRPRSEMETNPEFKQLIPYMIFCHTDPDGHISIFQYVRGKGMGESRLHQKRSIGIGGHISAEDISIKDKTAPTGGYQPTNIYREGMMRELHEEVILRSTFTEQCVGLINDDSTEVGRVHLGIIHRLDLAEPNVLSNESDLIESGFMPLEQLRQYREEMESWSAISLDVLF